MADSPIPEEVLEFIDRSVSSIDQLEILLLLRSHRERHWSASEVSTELRSNPDSAEQRLRSLHTAGFLAPIPADGRYRYQPETPYLDALVGRLAQCYRDYRLRVIERVFNRSERT